MKISESPPVMSIDQSYDTVTISISHNIRIDGAESWVKYEQTHRIVGGEDPQVTQQALIEHVSSQVIRVAEEAAKKVMER